MPTLDQRVIAVIDYLTSSDVCEEAEIWLASGKNHKDKDKKAMAALLGSIYKIAHGFNKSNSCHHVHEDWRKEFLKIEKEMWYD